MNEESSDGCELVPLAEAERLCCEKLGMTAAQFRHELAEHVRGHGGIPWVATDEAAGVYRSVLDRLVGRADAPEPQEMPNE